MFFSNAETWSGELTPVIQKTKNPQILFHFVVALPDFQNQIDFAATAINKGTQGMHKKKYNPTANQQILPFRKIDRSVTLEIFFY